MNKRILAAFLTALLLLSGCSQPLMSTATSNEETAMTRTSEAKTDAGTTNAKQTTYPTDDLNLPRVAVELVKAVDGDTISVMFEGKRECSHAAGRHARDKPSETGRPAVRARGQGFTKELVEQADRLELEFDIGPNRDKYSRLLAYVYADGKMVQESLLEEGLARVAYIYPPNTRYVDKFDDLQRISRDKGLGIWSVENYAQEDGFHPEEQDDTNKNNNPDSTATQAPTGKPQPSKQACDIKGNINSKGEKIYHTPESPYYERTKQEQWFCSEEEAEQAGFRAPLK